MRTCWVFIGRIIKYIYWALMACGPEGYKQKLTFYLISRIVLRMFISGYLGVSVEGGGECGHSDMMAKP